MARGRRERRRRRRRRQRQSSAPPSRPSTQPSTTPSSRPRWSACRRCLQSSARRRSTPTAAAPSTTACGGWAGPPALLSPTVLGRTEAGWHMHTQHRTAAMRCCLIYQPTRSSFPPAPPPPSSTGDCRSAEFRVWHEGQDMYYVMWEKDAASGKNREVRVDAFPVASGATPARSRRRRRSCRLRCSPPVGPPPANRWGSPPHPSVPHPHRLGLWWVYQGWPVAVITPPDPALLPLLGPPGPSPPPQSC